MMSRRGAGARGSREKKEMEAWWKTEGQLQLGMKTSLARADFRGVVVCDLIVSLAGQADRCGCVSKGSLKNEYSVCSAR